MNHRIPNTNKLKVKIETPEIPLFLHLHTSPMNIEIIETATIACKALSMTILITFGSLISLPPTANLEENDSPEW